MNEVNDSDTLKSSHHLDNNTGVNETGNYP